MLWKALFTMSLQETFRVNLFRFGRPDKTAAFAEGEKTEDNASREDIDEKRQA
jgi:hypothetical protein